MPERNRLPGLMLSPGGLKCAVRHGQSELTDGQFQLPWIQKEGGRDTGKAIGFATSDSSGAFAIVSRQSL